MKTYAAEVIVVGGGPAGSMTAGLLADRGLEVLLLEKGVFPREKPCAGGLTLRALSALGLSLPQSLVHEKCYVFRAVLGECVRETCFEQPYVLTVDRSELDAFLLQWAVESGAAVHTGERVLSLQPDLKAIQVQTEKATYSTPLVVGADGIPSLVARACGQRSFNEAAVCLCANIPRPPVNCDRFRGVLETHWGLFDWGYGWIFPKRDHLSVGLGMWGRGRNLKALWADFLTSLDLPPVQPQGHLIPVGGKPELAVADGFVLVGDAAGFADPLTGEGLYYAFLSARLAAQVIWALKRQGLPYTAGNLAQYQKKCWQKFGRDLNRALRLNKMARRCPRLWHQAFKGSADWFVKALQVVQGEASYQHLFRWAWPRLPLLWLQSQLIH